VPKVSWNAAVDRDGNRVPDLRVFLLDGQKLKITNPKSAWGRAGLHTGDKLVTLNGNQINAPAEFRSMLGRLHVNDKVTC
jgi:predicted metalloprotease with PDZ domain